MMYYVIKNSTEKKNIGAYPQTTLHPDDFRYVQSGSADQIYYELFPAVAPELHYSLNQGAIATDILDRGTLHFGLIVSEKLKAIFESFTLPPHRFYPVKVQAGEETLSYYWFHFYNELSGHVIPERSTVGIFDKFKFNLIRSVPFTNMDMVKQLKQSKSFNEDVRIEKFYLQPSFAYDVFEENMFGYQSVISDKVLSAMKAQGITGYTVVELKTIVKED